MPDAVRFPAFILLALLGFAGLAPAGELVPPVPERPPVDHFRFQRGDDPAWAHPDFDDSEWPRIGRFRVPSREGIYWLRCRIAVDPRAAARGRDTLSLAVVASYDVFWDGQLIGRNGRVGASAAEEAPGLIDNTFRIPDELNGPGEHVLALRMSSYHTGFPGPHFGVTPRITALRDYLAYRAQATAFSLVAVGGAFVVGLVFGLMWLLADRKPATALFSLACFVAAAQQALQAWRGLLDYTYDWHYPRLLAIALLVGALGVLLVAFLQAFFRLRASAWRVALLVALLVAAWQVSPLYNVKATVMSWLALAFALVLTFEAWRGRRRGAGYVFAGLLLGMLGLARSPVEFLEHSFVFSSGAAMLGCVTAFALQARDERRAARQAQLTAARLEIELLKKNIQPHFVLNTLTTIMEVIEQDPKAAVALIEALADEFRILNRVSGEKLIPLEQELALCRAHLQVMSLRKGAACALHARGLDPQALVPPALFLTLVENGLTHLLPRDGRLEFILDAQSHAAGTRYSLSVHGIRQAATDAAAGRREGTGLRYLKARLEESFTGRWSVLSRPVPEGWQTIVEIGAGGPRAAPAATTELPSGMSPARKPA